MDVLTAIHSRRAVRDCRDEPVAADVIAALIDAAVWAPSGRNLQPWTFAIEDQAETLAATALGLGSCWIVPSEAWLNTDEGKAAPGIPSALRAVAPIIVGRPKGLLPATTRRTADVRSVGKVSPS